MNEQIKQIAERLRGLRDVLELTAEDIARDSDISAEEYRLAETGDYDISVSMLQKIARTSKLITRRISSMSIPRATMSVATNILIRPALNSCMTVSR